MPASVSSWTRAAYEDLDAADEPAELEEDAEPLIEEEEEDPSGWSVAPSASGRPFFWHRISRRSVWHLPPGASVRKKKGEEEEEEEEEEADASVLFILLLCPRSWSTAAVARFWFSW